mmetsp:Transcript_13284/g.36026  ORF Transcript_13284/g.36026 Transcript_13284/m.36026 type:complete len:226 (-) Transcript_13284:57-734(-)
MRALCSCCLGLTLLPQHGLEHASVLLIISILFSFFCTFPFSFITVLLPTATTPQHVQKPILLLSPLLVLPLFRLFLLTFLRRSSLHLLFAVKHVHVCLTAALIPCRPRLLLLPTLFLRQPIILIFFIIKPPCILLLVLLREGQLLIDLLVLEVRGHFVLIILHFIVAAVVFLLIRVRVIGFVQVVMVVALLLLAWFASTLGLLACRLPPLLLGLALPVLAPGHCK